VALRREANFHLTLVVRVALSPNMACLLQALHERRDGAGLKVEMRRRANPKLCNLLLKPGIYATTILVARFDPPPCRRGEKARGHVIRDEGAARRFARRLRREPDFLIRIARNPLKSLDSKK
jgi:hypothetical protein